MNAPTCHFVWRDGRVSDHLACLLATAQSDEEQCCFHLDEGHLQTALSDQGYGVIVEGISKGKQSAVFIDRLQTYLSMHKHWDANTDFVDHIEGIGRLFKTKSSELLATTRKKLSGLFSEVADFFGTDDTAEPAAEPKPKTKKTKKKK